MNWQINVNIKNENGKLLIGSRNISAVLEKEHKDMLREIEEVLTVGKFSERKFALLEKNRNSYWKYYA